MMVPIYCSPAKDPAVKVEQIHLRQATLRLSSPFITSFGTIIERPCIIVEVEAGGAERLGGMRRVRSSMVLVRDGHNGVARMLDYLIPTLMGQEIDDPEAIWGLYARVRGHNMAKAA